MTDANNALDSVSGLAMQLWGGEGQAVEVLGSPVEVGSEALANAGFRYTEQDLERLWLTAFDWWLHGKEGISKPKAPKTVEAYMAAWDNFRRFSGKDYWRVTRWDVIKWLGALENVANKRPAMYVGPFVGNTRSMLYHYPGCPQVGEMAEENRAEIVDDEVAGRAGYRKCGGCHERIKPATMNQWLAALSSFYSYCQRSFLVPLPTGREVPLTVFSGLEYNPVKAVDRPEQDEMPQMALTGEQVEALLGAIRAEAGPQGKRDYALFYGYVLMGRRNAEWRTLRKGDLVPGSGGMAYRWKNKRKHGLDEIPATVWEAVLDYLGAIGLELGTMEDGDYVFRPLKDTATRFANVSELGWTKNRPLTGGEVNSLLKKYARRAGLDDREVHVHTLRHTAAEMMRQAACGVEEISEQLRHSSLDMTKHYLKRRETHRHPAWQRVNKLIGQDGD